MVDSPVFERLSQLLTRHGVAFETQRHEAAQINFNAGDQCVSIRMDYADYVRLEEPQIIRCAL